MKIIANIEKQINDIDNQITEAYPYKSNTKPDINGPKKYPIAKHWDKRAKAKPFLFAGAILKTKSVEVGRKEEVPRLMKNIEIKIKNNPDIFK